MSSEESVKTRKARETYGISPEDFVLAWQQSDSVNEVIEKLSVVSGKPVPKEVVQARASVYRRAGVMLKKMSRSNRRKLDVSSLNECIAQPAA